MKSCDPFPRSICSVSGPDEDREFFRGLELGGGGGSQPAATPTVPPRPGVATDGSPPLIGDGQPPRVGDLVEVNLPPGLPVPLVRGVAMPRWATMPLGLTGERMPHGNRSARV